MREMMKSGRNKWMYSRNFGLGTSTLIGQRDFHNKCTTDTRILSRRNFDVFINWQQHSTTKVGYLLLTFLFDIKPKVEMDKCVCWFDTIGMKAFSLPFFFLLPSLLLFVFFYRDEVCFFLSFRLFRITTASRDSNTSS